MNQLANATGESQESNIRLEMGGMITDPLGTLRSVYERFGLSFSAAAERGAKAWLEHPAQHLSPVKFDFD
jgi:hypothetical protein